MTIQRLTVDHKLLPAALLPAIKSHIRVDHARDDDLVTSYIAAAIGLVERGCNVSLDPATYLVTAGELRAQVCLPWPLRASYALPLNNVVTAVLNDPPDTAPPDFADTYTLWNPDFGGNGSSYLVAPEGGRIDPAWVLELDVGLDAIEDLAPAFFSLLGRLTGALYENREASVALWGSTWNAELAALWRPSA